MAIKTPAEQLEEVQAAISKVMLGQEATYEGKRVRYADLSVLEAREEKLLSRYRRELGIGGPAINVCVPRRDY